MKDLEIKSISETFSMEPKTLEVGGIKPYRKIKEIRPEVITLENGEQLDVYRGYGFDGKMLFQYIAKAVNVHYF